MCDMCFIAVGINFVYTVTVYRAQNTEHETLPWYQSEHVSNELILLTFTTGVQDGQGHSLVDIILTNMDECLDPDWGLKLALYLINHGVDDQQDKVMLLCKACNQGNLDVVKELVEQHNVDPNGEYYDCIHLHTILLIAAPMQA